MPPGFRELDDITADVGLEAWGQDLEQAFASTASGLASLMSDLPGGDHPSTRRIRITADSLPGLLVRFLNEIIYLYDTEAFLTASVTRLTISDHTLEAALAGATYDPSHHNLNARIKAATYHGLRIEERPGEVRVQVIFDV